MPRVHINVGPPNLLDLLRILLRLGHRRLLLDLAVVSGHQLCLRLLLILEILRLHFYARLLNVLLVSLVLLGCRLFDPALHDLLLTLQRGALWDWLLLLLHRRTLFLLNMPYVLCPTQRCTLLLIFRSQARRRSFSSFPIIIRYDQILNLLVH